MTRYGQQPAKCLPDPSYGNNPAEPDNPCDELKHRCQEYLIRLQVINGVIKLHYFAFLFIGD